MSMAVRILLQPVARGEDVSRAGSATPCDTAEAAWEHVLHSYAEALDEHRSLMATVAHSDLGELIVPRFQPPAGLPPLPQTMLAWAEALARETDELVQQATEFLSRSRSSTAPSRLGRFSDDASSSFDRKA